MLNNKSILITKGTGSLGTALTRTILARWLDLKRIVIYSRRAKAISDGTGIPKYNLECHMIFYRRCQGFR